MKCSCQITFYTFHLIYNKKNNIFFITTCDVILCFQEEIFWFHFIKYLDAISSVPFKKHLIFAICDCVVRKLNTAWKIEINLLFWCCVLVSSFELLTLFFCRAYLDSIPGLCERMNAFAPRFNARRDTAQRHSAQKNSSLDNLRIMRSSIRLFTLFPHTHAMWCNS